MSDLDTLRRMIVGAAQIPLRDDKYGHKIVELTESQCPDSSVTIGHIPEEAVVINVDDFWLLEKMFTGEKGQCKRADYVIVADTGTRKVIIYIEMKKTHGQENTVTQQLTGAQCFIVYCREIARAPAFWDQRNFLHGYEERFVYFGRTNTSINKRPTRNPPEIGIHDCPDRVLKINAQDYVTLRHLIERGC